MYIYIERERENEREKERDIYLCKHIFIHNYLYLYIYLRRNIYLVQQKTAMQLFQCFTCTFRVKMDPYFFLSLLPVKFRGKVYSRWNTIRCLQVFSKQQPAVFYLFTQNSSRPLKERIRIAS